MMRLLQVRKSVWSFGSVAALTLVFFSQSVLAGTFEVSNSREVRAVKAKIRAAQFLSKATFGPTQQEIDALAARISRVGYRRATGEWVDRQFDLPQTSQVQTAKDIIDLNGREYDADGIGVSLYRHQAWTHIALTGEDQLRQRVAWALSQIFVIGEAGANFNNNDRRNIGDVDGDGVAEQSEPDWIGMGLYYDMLAKHASGNYRELLEDVTFNPCMGVWLSSVRNRKANIPAGRYPDENYAREIMQLFSIGLYQLHQDGRLRVDENGALIPTYDNEGIKELARVFTGLRYHKLTPHHFYTGFNLTHPMSIYPLEHDNNYNYSEDPNNPGQIDPNEVHSKTILGVTLDPLPYQLTEAAVKKEIDQALDAIFNHPNVGPFITRRLIQRLVKSNPSRGYIRRASRVFNNNGRGVRGDLKAVVKAILTDPEAIRGQRLLRRRSPMRVEVVTRGTEFCRMKEPLTRFTAFIRALNPTSDYEGGYMMFDRGMEYWISQMAYRSPTVFNFYLPDFQPPGDLSNYTPSRRNPYGAAFAPEFQLLNGVTANRTIQIIKSLCRNRYLDRPMRLGRCRITFNLDEEIEMAKDLNNLDELLRRFDLLLCNGTLKESTKTIIKDAITTHSGNLNNNNVNDERLEEMLLAILISPDCVIEE